MNAIANWPKDAESTFRELHDDFGMSPTAIAVLLGLPVADVEKSCRTYGIVPGGAAVDKPSIPVAPAGEPKATLDTPAPVTPPPTPKRRTRRARQAKPGVGDERFLLIATAKKRTHAHELTGCKWIDGDVGRKWSYCQKQTLPGSDWCAEHHARVYHPKVRAA